MTKYITNGRALHIIRDDGPPAVAWCGKAEGGDYTVKAVAFEHAYYRQCGHCLNRRRAQKMTVHTGEICTKRGKTT